MLDFAAHPSPQDLVLVHGAGGNDKLWSLTMRHLSGGARAYAVDLPGHPAGAVTCTSIGDYSEALNSFIVEAGLSRPVVAGHSMGGAVALTLALEHPESVGGLVLVSTGAKLGVDPAILEGLRGLPMRAIEQVITPRSFYSIDLGLGREARAALSVSNFPIFLNDYLACQGFDARGRLPGVYARTLVVCGDRDLMTPPKWSHYLHDNLLDSELRFVKDSGHMLPLEKPEPLGRMVQAFLSGFSQ